jgi:2-oxo-3-hexenedioate decarboxylase
MLPITGELLLRCYDDITQVDRGQYAPLESLAQASAIQDEIVAARVARGEKQVGYKIGFTNRTIWKRYGVTHPIWGPMYESTVEELVSNQTQVDPHLFAEPRLEPEIVVRLTSVPSDATPEAVARSLQWVAHGFEIVQSHFTGWQFTGAESFAAQGLHGALKIGPRFAPSDLAESADLLPQMLSKLSLSLFCDVNPEPVDTGVGSNVLDGPLHAIAFLMQELDKQGKQLHEGDIITTGTITDAQPIISGQLWQSALTNVPKLQNLQLRTEASAH